MPCLWVAVGLVGTFIVVAVVVVVAFFYLVLFLHCFRLPNAIIRPTIIINVQIFPVRWYAHTIQQQSIRLFLLQFLENSDNVFTECPIVCEFSIRFHTLVQFFSLSSQRRFDFMFEQQNWRYRICTANKLINSEIKANTKTNSFDAIEWIIKKEPRKKYTKFQRLWSNYSQIGRQILRSHFHFKVKQYRSFKYEIFFLMKTPLSWSQSIWAKYTLENNAAQ